MLAPKPDKQFDAIHNTMVELIMQRDQHKLDLPYVTQFKSIESASGKFMPVPRSIAQRQGGIAAHVLRGQHNMSAVLDAIAKSDKQHSGIIYTTGTLTRLGIAIPTDAKGAMREPDGEIYVPIKPKADSGADLGDKDPAEQADGNPKVRFIRQPFYLAENVPGSPEFKCEVNHLLAPESSVEKIAALEAVLVEATKAEFKRLGLPHRDEDVVTFDPEGTKACLRSEFAHGGRIGRGKRELHNVSLMMPSLKNFSVIPPSVRELGVDATKYQHGQIDVASAVATWAHEMMHANVKAHANINESAYWEGMRPADKQDSLAKLLGRSHPSMLYAYGKKPYDQEEMLVEGAALKIMSTQGLAPYTLENSASYIHDYARRHFTRDDLVAALDAQRGWQDALVSDFVAQPHVKKALTMTADLVPKQDLTAYLEKVQEISDKAKHNQLATQLSISPETAAEIREAAINKGLTDPILRGVNLQKATPKLRDRDLSLYPYLADDSLHFSVHKREEPLKGRLLHVSQENDALLVGQLIGKGRVGVFKLEYTPEMHAQFKEALDKNKKVALDMYEIPNANPRQYALGIEGAARPEHTLAGMNTTMNQTKQKEMYQLTQENQDRINLLPTLISEPRAIRPDETITGKVFLVLTDKDTTVALIHTTKHENVLVTQAKEASLEGILNTHKTERTPVTVSVDAKQSVIKLTSPTPEPEFEAE